MGFLDSPGQSLIAISGRHPKFDYDDGRRFGLRFGAGSTKSTTNGRRTTADRAAEKYGPPAADLSQIARAIAYRGLAGQIPLFERGDAEEFIQAGEVTICPV